MFDPIAQQIKKFDLEQAALVDTIELDYVPAKLVWLGIAAAEGTTPFINPN